jgi:hypothetical protein
VRERLKHEIEALRGEIAALMQAAVQAGTDALAESSDNVVVSASATCWACRTSATTWAACAGCSTCSSRRPS